MDRREFLETVTVATAGIAAAEPLEAAADIESHTLISEFTEQGVTWKVYEDLNARDGDITFVSSRANRRVFVKTAESCFAEADPPYLGLKMADIGTAGR